MEHVVERCRQQLSHVGCGHQRDIALPGGANKYDTLALLSPEMVEEKFFGLISYDHGMGNLPFFHTFLLVSVFIQMAIPIFEHAVLDCVKALEKLLDLSGMTC